MFTTLKIRLQININFVVFFLVGDSPASEFYMPTFRNTLSSNFIGVLTPPINMDDGTSARKIQTPEESAKRNNTAFGTQRRFQIKNNISFTI